MQASAGTCDALCPPSGLGVSRLSVGTAHSGLQTACRPVWIIPGSELEPKSPTEISIVTGERNLTLTHLEVWMQSLQCVEYSDFQPLDASPFQQPNKRTRGWIVV